MRRKEYESDKDKKRNNKKTMNQHQFPAGMIKKLPTYSPTRGEAEISITHTYTNFKKGATGSEGTLEQQIKSHNGTVICFKTSTVP